MKKYLNKIRNAHRLFRILPDWVYHLTLQTNSSGGTLTAPVTGATAGSTVSLTASPNYDYVFDNYSVTGATINGDTLTFGEQDCTAKANFTKVGTGLYNTCVYEPNYRTGDTTVTRPGIIPQQTYNTIGLKMKWNIQPKQSITPQNVYNIRLSNNTWCSGYAWETPNPQSQSVEAVQSDLWWGHYTVSGQELSAAGYKMPVVDAGFDNIWHYINPKLSAARTSVGGSYLYWNTATNCWGEHEFTYLFNQYFDYTKENEPHVSAYLDGELQYVCWHPAQLFKVDEIQGFDYGAYPTSVFSGSVCPIQVCTFGSVSAANRWAQQ